MTGGDIRNAVLAAVLEAALEDRPDDEKVVAYHHLAQMASEVLEVKAARDPRPPTQNATASGGTVADGEQQTLPDA